MTYLVLKWLHLVSVLLFSSGMLVTPWLVNGLCTRPRTDTQQAFLENVRGYHRKITSVAILLVWGLGLAMAQSAQWWSHPWFRAKLLVALLLSAQHGAISGRLRHLCREPERTFPPLRFPWFALGMTIAAGLVVFKPSI
ncbi:MAG: CopD family protein [Candidatus Eremiobacteraeota bacterium]|nr:CopD family protein [Candidatus Eremiobacteraeota bacterium]